MTSNNPSIVFLMLSCKYESFYTAFGTIGELMQKLNVLEEGGNFKIKVHGAEYFLGQ